MPQEDEIREAAVIIGRLIKLERAGERTEMLIGPYSAFILVGMLQLAMRHPAYRDEPTGRMARIIRSLGDQFGAQFEGYPAGELLKKGWDPANDR